MDEFLRMIKDFSDVSAVLRLLLAVILGGLIGSERGRHGRAAGLRTHILVCIGAALSSLTGLFIAEMGGGDISRISAQVVSGIGFLGVGTILVRNNSVVTGLTTAAGMWTTAAIGIAVGYGFYTASVVATFLCIFTATFLSKLERSQKNNVHFYAEVSAPDKTGDIIESIKALDGVTANVEIINPKSNCNGHVGLVIDIKKVPGLSAVKPKIKEMQGICFIVEE